jgi:orotidine-5'-phosphate decarboxylase
MRSTPRPHERLLVALDTNEIETARGLARQLKGHVGGFKIGLELFCSHGPDLVRELSDGSNVFVDLKLHDIPNTVAGAAAALGRLGVTYFTVHAMGGSAMIRRGVEAAAAAAATAGQRPPIALAVSVLTSHDDRSLDAIGLQGPCSVAVERLAVLARDAGAGGLVCSAREVRRVREIFPEGTLVVPGIRPAASAAVDTDDQARTGTPGDVIRAGGDLLVVGRPITGATDPVRAARSIAEEIGAAVS